MKQNTDPRYKLTEFFQAGTHNRENIIILVNGVSKTGHTHAK